MESIKTIVFKSRKIKEKSWKTYERYINELSNKAVEKTYESNDFLSDTEKINEILNSYGESKRRVALSVILVLLSPDKTMTPVAGKFPEDASDLYKEYHELHKNLTTQYTTKMESQTKTEKQEANWVEWPEIIKLQRKFMNEFRRLKFNKKTVSTITKAEILKLQDYLVLSLYTLIKPRRLDYAGMKVMSYKDFQEFDDKKSHNILVVKSKVKKFFSFGPGAQKNENGSGNQCYELVVPPSLNRVLQLFLKFNNGGSTNHTFHLLSNRRRSGPISNDGLSKQIMRIMNDEFKKSISASLLRTIFRTHYDKDGKSIKEKKACAAEMGHSTNTAEIHYTKKD